MSYKTELQGNNADLEAILETINTLPEAASEISDINGLQEALDGKAQIETGSYTGTGTYGRDNPNSLTFDFEPKLVIVCQTSGISESGGYARGVCLGIFASESELNVGYRVPGNNYAEPHYLHTTWSKNTISWYNINAGTYQLNSSGSVYKYTAIG